MLSLKLADKPVDMASLVGREVPPVLEGDPGRLRQVLLNLIGNAVKFTEKGEIVVSASLEQTVDAPGGLCRVRFEVRDTGVGIGEDAQSLLFQPFTQADNSTTRRFGGTGLGLAISRQIVELMEGSIGVKSEVGKGSTFWFVVPLGSVPPTPGHTRTGQLRGARFLALHESPTGREVMHHFSNTLGFRLTTATGVAEAVEQLGKAMTSGDPYEGVLVDFRRPVPDGLQFAAALASDATTAAVPVILVTSLQQRLSAVHEESANIVSVITRPLREKVVLRALEDALAGQRGPKSPVGSAPPRRRPHERQALSELKVLVVEDNAVNQRVVEMQLRKTGCRADFASNGVEALQAVEQARYDVVLMDCQMPEMDGYEATRRLRSDPRFAGVRIIAMTANAMLGDREKCLAAGMDDYVSKPLREAELRAALGRALAPG